MKTLKPCSLHCSDGLHGYLMEDLSIFFRSSYYRLGTSIFRWDIVWADPYLKQKKKLTRINHKCYLNVFFVDFETVICSIVLTLTSTLS